MLRTDDDWKENNEPCTTVLDGDVSKNLQLITGRRGEGRGGAGRGGLGRVVTGWSLVEVSKRIYTVEL